MMSFGKFIVKRYSSPDNSFAIDITERQSDRLSFVSLKHKGGSGHQLDYLGLQHFPASRGRKERTYSSSEVYQVVYTVERRQERYVRRHEGGLTQDIFWRSRAHRPAVWKPHICAASPRRSQQKVRAGEGAPEAEWETFGAADNEINGE